MGYLAIGIYAALCVVFLVFNHGARKD